MPQAQPTSAILYGRSSRAKCRGRHRYRREKLASTTRQGKSDRRTIGCLYENRAPSGVPKIVNKKSPRSNPSQDTAESYKQATCNIPHAAPDHPDQMGMSSCVISRSLASTCTKGAPWARICWRSATQKHDISPLEKRIGMGWKPCVETDNFEKKIELVVFFFQTC